MERAHILISGDVQGVLYRSSALDIAQKLGLVGWVKNTFGGEVEIVAEGSKESLNELVKWCKDGPKFARVGNVAVDWQEAKGKFSFFQVK